MSPSKVAELLKGKVIKEVKHFPYLGWGMCVEEIVFTDGTVIELAGNADFARIEKVRLPDGDDEICPA